METVRLSDVAPDNPPGFVLVCVEVECAVIVKVSPAKNTLLLDMKRREMFRYE